jgi:hypothetical protein
MVARIGGRRMTIWRSSRNIPAGKIACGVNARGKIFGR